MKSTATSLVLLAVLADAAKVGQRHGQSLRKVQVDMKKVASLAKSNPDFATPEFGSPSCPCVGVSGIEGGHVEVRISENQTAQYPADAFTSCKPWDDGYNTRHCKDETQTPGKGKGWCSQSWCFVDPCNCKLSTPPKKALEGGYFPNAKFQGRDLWYSYATCGAVDEWLEKEEQNKQAEEPKFCAKAVDDTKWGLDGCKCIGINGQPGTTNVSIAADLTMAYPSDVGATCEAWDNKQHPDCTKKNKPKWCEQAWCFVDPCSCNIGVPPKPTVYLPGSSYQGRPLHYSYMTCGGDDAFSEAGNAGACAVQTSLQACQALQSEDGSSKCKWEQDSCVEAEIAAICFASQKNQEEDPMPRTTVTTTTNPFLKFLPICEDHLQKTLRKVEHYYTKAQIESALITECDLDAKFPDTRDEMFLNKQDCIVFSKHVALARHAELDGKQHAYDRVCGEWYQYNHKVEPKQSWDKAVGGLILIFATCIILYFGFRN
eukprot:TRINITY_DN3471_c0_g1_i1.p1 TRINITY_DN3471_c0_g1~~TRINITY_DN3471_c0_g1_i1.p1  ORF type:complete len:487 (+),score=107.05 TRINITY_DN3471_c0_g1_i1:101-1561(+)